MGDRSMHSEIDIHLFVDYCLIRGFRVERLSAEHAKSTAAITTTAKQKKQQSKLEKKLPYEIDLFDGK